MEPIKKQVQIVRGVVVHNQKVLLAKELKNGFLFLPGGHVEVGESIKVALVREFKEELNWDVTTGAFLGCVENLWYYTRKGDNQPVAVYEINFLFAVTPDRSCLAAEPTSTESHISFQWVPLDALADFNVLPGAVKDVLKDLKAVTPQAIWSSNLESPTQLL
jgi:8-oxo-dGTP diphosphatase